MLAAGRGKRLRPLTDVRPKPLMTVGGRTLLDRALDRVAPHVRHTAVNAHHLAEQIVDALAGRDVHVSVEEPEALGTAGALGRLRPWIDGAAVLVSNADAFYLGEPVTDLLAGWDGERPRLLCTRTDTPSAFGDLLYVGSALLPWWSVERLEPVPSGLYEVSWRDLYAAGRLDLAVTDIEAFDCGTPADLRRADAAAWAAERAADTFR